ncbi:2-polyprenyl-3-methyl-5-hydroxy-6-metoxy-1,4-benzoquinol methylase [Catenulispora sp. EB89]|uniref:3' terminal RNA ribose 2'-O-methyltransferase Hen1 n=1 Tax=Catenulispora sp. EB89 TaxID=3156257 RepID=UPI0035163448
MLLTITATPPPGADWPATDLGFLLHKNPERVQAFDVTYGKAHVFYPAAGPQECTAALLLEVDPIALVRGRGRNSPDFALSQYVNDRPYAASSLLASALGHVFRSALRGRCDQRPELAATALPLRIEVPALICADPELAAALFEPLGWTVEAEPVALDPAFPAWGASRYTKLTLTGTHRLSDALSHLFVLLAALDGAKHYWVASDEVDKLVRVGEGWLGTHPLRAMIARRYLARRQPLVREALARLAEVDDVEPEALDNAVGFEEDGTELIGGANADPAAAKATGAALTITDAAAPTTETASVRATDAGAATADLATANATGAAPTTETASAAPTADPAAAKATAAAPTITDAAAPTTDTPAAPTTETASASTTETVSVSQNAPHPPRGLTHRQEEGAPGDYAQESAAAPAAVNESESKLGHPSERKLSLATARREAVVEALHEVDAARVLDLGCGEGALLRDLLKDKAFSEVVGVDVSARALQMAARKLRVDRLPDRVRARLTLRQGALTYTDARLAGYDAAVLMEVIEHVDPHRLPALEHAVFRAAHPRAVVVTTPNVEYNVRYETLEAGRFRHSDHRFEWTRAEFRDWAERVAAVHGYDVRFKPVGEIDPELGPSTQLALFTVAKNEKKEESADV